MKAKQAITLLSWMLAGTWSAHAAPAPGSIAEHLEGGMLHEPQMPFVRQALPPTREQMLYDLPATQKPRLDLMTQQQLRSVSPSLIKALASIAACENMDTLAGYSGSALADYLVALPSYECHYGLFSLTASQAAVIYSPANFAAVADRFVVEAGRYDASNIALVNLLIYLRAGYYLASGGTLAAPSPALITTMRPAIKQLIDGSVLFKSNSKGSSTANETFKLITNQSDEAFYLGSIRNVFERYTNTPANPNASEALKNYSAGAGFSGALVVIYYAHFRPDSKALLQGDPSYAIALNNFVLNNKASLLGSSVEYDLNDAATEAYRFLKYPALKPTVKPMVQNILATTSMTGVDSALWLAGANAVKYYDNASCSDYGSCNFETALANAVLSHSYTCSPSIHIRSQQLTDAQMQTACQQMQAEEGYFHTMLQTGKVPVKDDGNTSLEVVVFNDSSNYQKYAGTLFGISTNNGGMYLEGNPAAAGNQARFIAYEASWLRPSFKIWNLEHEYIHYLDGRFDTYGDFALETSKPTVWWIEGLAEYLSLRNNNPTAISAAQKGSYKLSEIFQNTYAMNDYVERAYRWGYMAVRFMNEKHRSDIDAILPRFRVGDYAGYDSYMKQIGTRYDAEFASWAAAATTSGEPPLPGDSSPLPACPSTSELSNGCSIGGLASSYQAYAHLWLPTGAKNLQFWTMGGSGDVDLYVAADRYPTTSNFDQASTDIGNAERVSIATPATWKWYYITLRAKQPCTGVSINASYDLAP
ncbi:collagenase [Chitinimonas sp.]|uniref:M9 family metallopeptidase n=1 Tax=Chitinimonas sp. TaxID=1934313 RepID=UPI0035AEBFA7